jgi:predicted amidohydrolase YtcJ
MSAQLHVANRVRTADGAVGDAVLIEDGNVRALGQSEELRRRAPGAVEVRHGGVVVPGLVDAHFHPIGHALAAAGLSLLGTADLEQLAASLAAAAAELGPGEALVGQHLQEEAMTERRLPTRHDLDRMVKDRPVLLHRVCGHIAVANTAALVVAGVEPGAPDPVGGSFDRGPDGVPTGVLRETAVRVVTDAVGPLTPPLPMERVLLTLRELASLGLTGMGAIVAPGRGLWCGAGDELATLLEIAPDVPLRLAVLVAADSSSELEEAAERVRKAGPNTSFLGVKDFADGSMGGHTAALRQPFADRPGERGTLRLDPERTGGLARRALDLGGRVAIHAIGDLAVERTLDLFDRLLTEGADPAALRMEHASLTLKEDISRMAALGVTASVQPAFLLSETGWLERRLGPDRLRHTYAFASLAGAGVPLAGGSDCPVEPPHPLRGIAAARHRAGMVPEEALGGDAALALFTNGSSAACGLPRPLAIGSPADFVVLSGDPVQCAPGEVDKLEVLATYLGGKQVFP